MASVFNDEHGYDHEREAFRALGWKKGDQFEIVAAEAGRTSTRVWLAETGGQSGPSFNSVMFTPVRKRTVKMEQGPAGWMVKQNGVIIYVNSRKRYAVAVFERLQLSAGEAGDASAFID